MENVHTKQLKYFSMFSGIGGFEYGIERAFNIKCTNTQSEQTELEVQPGMIGSSMENGRDSILPSDNEQWRSVSCVGFSEIDKYAKQIYLKHFKEHKDYGDCTKIDWSAVPDFDCLVGGFPCQAFSIAGKRAGFSDTRGTLFFEIARALREKRPRLCVLENVKGLLSHDKGATFLTIIATLDELWYDCQWQVLNSKNFGVPQNRERVFIIGHLRGECRPKVFPIYGISKGNLTYCAGVISQREKWLNGEEHLSREFSQGQRIYDTKGISQTLAGNAGGQGGKTGLYQQEDMKIRRLTPTECERLQGFPDGWTEGISDTQRYKCLGNAVTTNVITAIFNKMIRVE